MSEHLPDCLLTTCVKPCAYCICICNQLRTAEQQGWENAMLRRNDGFEVGWNAAVEKSLEYMTRNGGCSAEVVIDVRTLRV